MRDHRTADTWLGDRDARAILLALIVTLAGVAMMPVSRLPFAALLLAVTALAGYVPVAPLLRRTAGLLPVIALLALAAVPARGWTGAGALACRAALSAFAALLAAEAASAPRLIGALARLGCPNALVLVVQLVYRFLFVFTEVVRNMRAAALARGIERAGRRRTFQAAAGAVAGLFGAAQRRAARVHAAMLARGFRGGIPSLRRERFGLGDAALVLGTLALVFTIGAR